MSTDKGGAPHQDLPECCTGCPRQSPQTCDYRTCWKFQRQYFQRQARINAFAAKYLGEDITPSPIPYQTITLKEARQHARMTLKQVADTFHVDATTVGRWEQGINGISEETFAELALLYQVDPAILEI